MKRWDEKDETTGTRKLINNEYVYVEDIYNEDVDIQPSLNQLPFPSSLQGRYRCSDIDAR
jgi:hypothetical protein